MTVAESRPARLAYLGARSDHRTNFTRLMEVAGRTVTCLDDSVEFGVYDRGRAGRLGALRRHAARAMCQVVGTRDGDYLDAVTRQIDAARIDCLVSYWGTRPVGDVIAIKRRRPHLKIILNVLCHPLSLSPGRIAVQNRVMRRAAQYLDGLIYPSRVMEAYFETHILAGRSLPSLVQAPYLPRQYFPDERVGDGEPTPNLVFLGRMDWWRAHPSDNMVGLLNELVAHGVHVSHLQTTEHLPESPFRHTFSYQPLESVIRFCSRFDASLVAYNDRACRRDDRLRVTVPDRLVASVAAGVPVAIPRRGYDASKEYVQGYEAVIEFESSAEIRAALSDRRRVEEFRSLAWKNRRRYHAEAHLDRLLDFLDGLGTSPETGRTQAVGEK